MYPNDNRYVENMPIMDNMNPNLNPNMNPNMNPNINPNMNPNMNPQMYNPQMRGSSLDMGGNRAPYYDSPYFDKAPQMMQPMYDYMAQPPMMPMN